MGIFDKIKNAIWGADDPAPRAPGADPVRDAALRTGQTTTGTTLQTDRRANEPTLQTADSRHAEPAPASTTASQPRMSEIDVAAQLDQAVKARGQTLNWRTSIVDLMKALGMDASLQERRELARELDYTGDVGDTAAMNIFLHRALMKRLAENGGKVPAEFLA